MYYKKPPNLVAKILAIKFGFVSDCLWLRFISDHDMYLVRFFWCGVFFQVLNSELLNHVWKLKKKYMLYVVTFLDLFSVVVTQDPLVLFISNASTCSTPSEISTATWVYNSNRLVLKLGYSRITYQYNTLDDTLVPSIDRPSTVMVLSIDHVEKNTSLPFTIPLWARGPQRLGWGAELTHTANGEW